MTSSAAEPVHQAPRPLTGIRIVSLALNLPGPAALLRLSALGAQCTKLEPPRRDDRTADPMALYEPRAYEALHAMQDPPLRLLHADLKSAEGQALLHAELEASDVLLTSFRPSALARLGADWETLHSRYPAMCMVAIVGEHGANRDRPGHDLTFVAAAGLVTDLTLPPTAFADMSGALLASEAVLRVLYQRERPGPTQGHGAYAEVALAEAARWLALPRAWGLMDPTSDIGGAHAGYRIYPCADGRVAVAALEPHFAARLCEATGLSATAASRVHDPSMVTHLRAYFASRTRAELEALGTERDIPWETMPPPVSPSPPRNG